GGIGDDQRDQNDLPLWNLPHPNNAQALRRYTEAYTYDAVGNLLEFFHDAGTGSMTWRRRYKYGDGSSSYATNRLHSTSLPGDAPAGPYSAAYTHDENGNMRSMPHLADIAYTHTDQMKMANLGGGGIAFYTYDASGERVLKRIERIGTLIEERIYLGGYEMYRKRDHTGLLFERQTLHVMDGSRRIAMVETVTVDTANPSSTGIARIRYQYTNHLDSAMVECDETGQVISYEEYHPFGTTAYRSASAGVEVSERRYRYTGKERDEETGLFYFGGRYLPPWLGRWTTVDPAGLVDGPGLYTYARNSPASLSDPDGRTVPIPPPIRMPWEVAEAKDTLGDVINEIMNKAVPPEAAKQQAAAGSQAPSVAGAAVARPLAPSVTPPARGEASGVFRIAPSNAPRGSGPKSSPGGGAGAAVAIGVGIVLIEMGVGWLIHKLSANSGGIASPPPGPPTPPPAPGMTPAIPPPPKSEKEPRSSSGAPKTEATPATSSLGKDFAFFNSSDPRNAIIASLENGILTTAIEAPKDAKNRISGSELFEMAVNHFGRNAIKGVRGSWTYGDNLKTINRLTGEGEKLSLEYAARQTFTGKMAERLGFTHVEIVGTPKGHPGSYKKVEVIFR
ncbi:MAG: RHS repeat-associated core domain-containing protein, partial [Polyangiaceae bacterium]|nr:RHS repeat-associated core domain-containing protein [Polyangiaceae bacterium]